MTEKPHKSHFAALRTNGGLFVIVPCVAIALLGGCAERRPKARVFPWATASLARPMPPETGATSSDDADENVPDLQPEPPPPSSSLALEHSVPARPRVPAAPAAPAEEAKPEPVQIAPQLTPEESSAAKQQTYLSLNIAQRNIETTQGKNLSASQMDVASKVRSFIAEAESAAHSGDWVRARSAAKKAEVLSTELASSI
jgi:hypothetical protein